MKKWVKAALVCMLIGCMIMPTFSVSAASSLVMTTPTDYRSASDVVYQKSGSYVKNWGARGEDCTFLSEYAEDFYTGNTIYDVMSEKKGGTSKSDAPSSALYSALKQTMTSKHKNITSYADTKELYRYTDCLRNDSSHISSFYSGKVLTGNWDSGATWNREHTWPNSKGLGGSDENDIMMLRPTWVQENSSRGNTAYGEGSAYYDPNDVISSIGTRGVRGDCARIVLYTYTRWGNTGNMWGTSGVMESVDILLKWMEEDPVDTWEMGRNDAVQSITGTRNIFVDYPEYAWLLFGEEIPSDMVTPSGEAMGTAASGGGSSSDNDVNEDSSASNESADIDIGDNNSTDEESSEDKISADESVSNSSNGISDMLAGCQSSIGGIAAYITLAMASAFVLKRKFK